MGLINKEPTQIQSALYVVATPIGHRQDISLRALEVLRTVDVIAAEDTRHAKKLLQFYQIDTPLLPLHGHNERRAAQGVLRRLSREEAVALITDAGTPLISDPGHHVVSLVQEANYKVIPIPGACAAIAALSVSGLSADQFIFAGFLPPKKEGRCRALSKFVKETRTIIFYEAPHRIVECLSDCIEVLGVDRQAVIARELTKSFETIRRGELGALTSWVKGDPYQQKGEFVVLLKGADKSDYDESMQKQAERMLQVMLESLPLKQAVSLAAKLSPLDRNRLYSLALKLKS